VELFELRMQSTGWAGLVGSSVMADEHQAYATHAGEDHGQRPDPKQDEARHGKLPESQTGWTECEGAADLQSLSPCFDLASTVPVDVIP